MTNLNVLKGKLREKGKTYAECAAEIGISTTSFCHKINGRNSFTVEEANKVAAFLEMTDQEKLKVFLY